MAYGLRVWNAAGNLVLDISDRITRYIGSVDTGTSNGSVTIPSEGTFWYYKYQFLQEPFKTGPEVSISGNVLSWNFDRIQSEYRISVTILYGAY